jgi:regulator of sigma E protease
VGIVKLIKGDISAKNLGGPIMIAQMAGDQAKQGLANLLSFIAFISINLAIVNFLPIPVLDGGHLLFFSIEAVTGRPVSIRMREIAQQVGIFILLSLTVFVFYNDIMRILS